MSTISYILTASVADPDPTDQAGSGFGWIRNYLPDPNGSGVGSGMNHFESGSGRTLSRMNLKQNLDDKIYS
jgi:hypothetical protein